MIVVFQVAFASLYLPDAMRKDLGHVLQVDECDRYGLRYGWSHRLVDAEIQYTFGVQLGSGLPQLKPLWQSPVNSIMPTRVA